MRNVGRYNTHSVRGFLDPFWVAISACMLASSALGQSGELTPPAAAQHFEEASELSRQDGGRHWGVSLYGPMLLVEPGSRRVTANEPATGLSPVGGVYVGVLPDELGIANTAITWGDKRWTMLMWPLPEDAHDRRSIVAHELWHRVQDEVGFPSVNAPNLHLGTRDGRIWLQLEWRALAAALRSEDSPPADAIRDAILFREQRVRLFPGSAEDERRLLLHEGLAEYTGAALSGRARHANREHAADALKNAESSAAFVRTFAYASGPAYGLLLDDLRPGWRQQLDVEQDLSILLAESIDFKPPDDLPAAAAASAAKYDGARLVEQEYQRDEQRQVRLREQRRRFVEGPVLRLDFVRMNVEFDPSGVDALDDLGSVYHSMRLTDVWGVLTVTGGALMASDWGHVVVPAPTDSNGTRFVGDGYSLDVNKGWSLTPGKRPGDLKVGEKR